MTETGPGQNKDSAPDVKALVARAVNEVTQHIKKEGKISNPTLIDKTAREMVHGSFRSAVDLHKTNPLSQQPENPLLGNNLIPESTKAILRKSQEQTTSQLKENHRSYVAGFFTLSGVSQETAEALADIIIAGA